MKQSKMLGLSAVALATILVAGCGQDVPSGQACGDQTCGANQECDEATQTCVEKQGTTPGGDKCEAVGLANCNDECIDTKTNPKHCGACNNACDAGYLCEDSQCKLTCTSDQTVCDNHCVDINNDDNNCGACGTVCQDGKTCSNGSCVLNCLEGWSVCNDTCIDTKNDNMNCGSCGNKCGTEDVYDENGSLVSEGKNEVCVSGSCVLKCLDGQTECNGKCVDTKSDTLNCGSCGHACGVDEACNNGNCSTSCSSSQTNCSGSCVNLNSDKDNCGSCGKKCDPGYSCKAGNCESNCLEGQTECNGICYDLKSDFNHCGSCDNACSTGEVCNNGQCGAEGCGENLTECSGSCVDVKTDVKNCGTCGNACADGFECTDGQCGCSREQTSCKIGEDESGTAINACVDAKNDDTYCGCSGDNAGVKCSGLDNVAEGSKCVEGACSFECLEGYKDCNENAADGCEAQLDSDVNNCGACNNKCAAEHASEVSCLFGQCNAVCETGYTYCGGACLDLTSDSNNCGACGNKCGDGFSCKDSYCVLTDCTLEDGKYAKVKVNDKDVTAYCVKSLEEFESVRDAVNEGARYPDNKNYDNAYILLEDLDLGLKTWKGIGDSKRPFTGTFLGNGKSISGNLTCTAAYCGLFGYAENATFDGFNIAASITMSGNNTYTGGLIGYASKCKISNTTASGTIKGYQYTGGIAGKSTGSTFVASRFTGAVTGSSSYSGGIAGESSSDTLTDCSLSNASVTGSNYVGGIAGTTTKSTFDKCAFSESKINNSQSYSGGIVGTASGITVKDSKASGRIMNSVQFSGLIAGNAEDSKFENTIVESGSVSGSGLYAGGFVGYTKNTSYNKCISKAKVTSTTNYVGGFAGIATDANPFKNCSAEEEVTGSASASYYVGGFVGHSYNGVTFENCSAKGNVTGYYEVGGFGGDVNKSQFLNCTASGKATSSYRLGGFVGFATNYSSFTNCHATGDVVDPTKLTDHMYAGGFSGFVQDYCSFNNCSASGNVIGNGDYRWELGGFSGNARNGVTFVKCGAFGNVTMGGSECGSFIGEVYTGTITIDTSFAVGDVSNCSSRNAGLVGNIWTNTTLKISDSYTTGFSKSVGEFGNIYGYNHTTGGVVKVTDVYYWVDGSKSEQGAGNPLAAGSTRYPFTYNDNKEAVVVNGNSENKLLESLNNNQNVWEEAKCALTGGPTNSIPGQYFYIPVIKGMKFDICE